MSAVTITVEIDGKQHDIKDCFWYFKSPCGCTSGVCVTDADGWLTTEAQAMAFMTPNRAVREQDIARGYSAELGHRDEITDRMKRDCPHTPEWGVVPVPEGMAWGHATRGRSAHLVTKAEEDRIDWDWREPLCGAKRDLFEIHSSVLGDAPMCKKCIALAEEADRG